MYGHCHREGTRADTYIGVSYGAEGVKARSWSWPAGFLVAVRQLAGQDIK